MSTISAPTGSLSPLAPSRAIPATWGESWSQWWSRDDQTGIASQERLLRRLPFYQPVGTSAGETGAVIAHSERVDLPTPKHFLNMLTIESTKKTTDSPHPVVMLHGYGAGLGFFYKNFPALAQWAGDRGGTVHALDWLGMGHSSRPPFTMKAKREDTVARVTEAESFFVDSLEQWREKMKIEKMSLVGHSLGAYFSTVYALKYPERVDKLILLSPAGVPHDKNGTTAPSRELTESQDEVSHDKAGGPAKPATAGRVKEVKEEQAVKQQQQSLGRKVLTHLWEQGYSPFQLARSTLFFAPLLIGKYSSRRFSGLTEDETRDLHDYIMHITLAKGSGEYCISHILAPGAHARLPLVDRIAPLKIPVTFVYGDHDWMDPAGGTQSVENMRKAGNGQGRMYVVPNAGHHVYLDNVKATNDLMLKELDRPLPKPRVV